MKSPPNSSRNRSSSLKIAISRSFSEYESARPRRSRRYGSPKNEIGREAVLFFQAGKVSLNRFFGAPRNGGAFKKHAADGAAQCANAPTFKAAHLYVEVTLKRILQVEDLFKVAPA